LSDARYPFIVFREVHWSPFLTPGEPAKELQNAENGGAIGQPVAPTSFWRSCKRFCQSPGQAGEMSCLARLRAWTVRTAPGMLENQEKRAAR
jgi:hypothetical protein